MDGAFGSLVRDLLIHITAAGEDLIGWTGERRILTVLGKGTAGFLMERDSGSKVNMPSYLSFLLKEHIRKNKFTRIVTKTNIT